MWELVLGWGRGAQTHPEAGVHLLQVAALVLQHALEQLPVEIRELRAQRIQVHCRCNIEQSTSDVLSVLTPHTVACHRQMGCKLPWEAAHEKSN